jgi:FolB domain-containing protein
MDKILIRDLLARGHIGITDSEREHPQDILINVTLYLDLTPAAITDHIDDTISYSIVSKEILSLVDQSRKKTVEAMAADIASLCLSHKLVERVQVRVEKPGAVRFTRSVGVEIERDR